MKISWLCLILITVLVGFAAPSISLAQQSVCSTDSLGSSQLNLPDHGPFSKDSAGHKAFFDWLGPTATFIQSKTGLPASVILAQAALESGYGTSQNFTARNALFGHSCFQKGSSQTGSTNLGGTSFPWSGACDANRPAAEGGQYLTFKSKSESVLAYVQLLLQKDSTAKTYSALRKDVQSASPPQAADSNKCISDIAGAGYAADKGYAQGLEQVVKTNALNQYDTKGDAVACNSATGIFTNGSSTVPNNTATLAATDPVAGVPMNVPAGTTLMIPPGSRVIIIPPQPLLPGSPSMNLLNGRVAR